MAEEHAPSYYLEEGPELVGEDQWDFLGAGFDPNLAYDEDFDFGTDEDPGKVDNAGSKDPDAKVIDGEGIQEVVGVAREEESAQDAGSSPVVPGQAGSDIHEETPEDRVDTHDNTSQPTRDIEPSPAVTAPKYTESKWPTQPHSDSIAPAQPAEDDRQKLSNAPSVNFGYDSAEIPLDTPYGTNVPAEQHLGDNTCRNAPSDGRPQDSQFDGSGTKSQVDKDQFWEDQEEIFGSLSNLGDENELQFPFDFNNDDWMKYADQMAHEDFQKW